MQTDGLHTINRQLLYISKFTTIFTGVLTPVMGSSIMATMIKENPVKPERGKRNERIL